LVAISVQSAVAWPLRTTIWNGSPSPESLPWVAVPESETLTNSAPLVSDRVSRKPPLLPPSVASPSDSMVTVVGTVRSSSGVTSSLRRRFMPGRDLLLLYQRSEGGANV
jgi:hypothetical protein